MRRRLRFWVCDLLHLVRSRLLDHSECEIAMSFGDLELACSLCAFQAGRRIEKVRILGHLDALYERLPGDSVIPVLDELSDRILGVGP